MAEMSFVLQAVTTLMQSLKKAQQQNGKDRLDKVSKVERFVSPEGDQTGQIRSAILKVRFILTALAASLSVSVYSCICLGSYQKKLASIKL